MPILAEDWFFITHQPLISSRFHKTPPLIGNILFYQTFTWRNNLFFKYDSLKIWPSNNMKLCKHPCCLLHIYCAPMPLLDSLKYYSSLNTQDFSNKLHQLLKWKCKIFENFSPKMADRVKIFASNPADLMLFTWTQMIKTDCRMLSFDHHRHTMAQVYLQTYTDHKISRW